MIKQCKGRSAPWLAVALLVAIPTASALAADAGVYSSGSFQLGDGQPPAGFAGTAQLASRPDQPGPAWDDLFDSAGWARDDFRQRFGGRWVAFTADNEGAAPGFEPSARGAGDRQVVNGSVAPSQDLADLLGYVTADAAGSPLVYFAVDRVAAGSTSLEFELNQDFVHVGGGGWGKGLPWSVVGERLPGDLRVRLAFDGEALTSISVDVYQSGNDLSGWREVHTFAGEGCNGDETVCAITNALSVDAGRWVSDANRTLAPGSLVEVGLSVGGLLPLRPDYVTLQARTPQDVAFAYFSMEGR